MYPWHETFRSWAEDTGLHIDALGLITLFGAEEMDRSIGRLMPSSYFGYLPLLGAFVVAGNRFTEKKTGYVMYNISAGIMTTELAGWFSRWLQAQDFHAVRSKVSWEVVEGPGPRRWKELFIGILLVALPVHGMLLTLTLLTADWWGFSNVVAMLVSVVVRCALVAENQAGIDANIEVAQKEVQEALDKYKKAKEQFDKRRQNDTGENEMKPPAVPKDHEWVKAIVVTQDSKVITIDAPAYLVRPAFTANPHIPSPGFYLTCRVIGWIAFAVHVIAIGMAALHTQICSVALVVVATVLTGYKVGCEDSRISIVGWNELRRAPVVDNDERWECWLTPKLKATVSSHSSLDKQATLQSNTMPTRGRGNATRVQDVIDTNKVRLSWSRLWRPRRKKATSTDTDLEQPNMVPLKEARAATKRIRRQDLYAWLDLTPEEDELMVAWGLIPRSREWQEEYRQKKEEYRRLQTGPASQIS
ncbi:uncharacterized protein DSM5745_02741 [Aspergillus mulundensis]|uniref:Uncharacterized protein n=1 Tax=Aspergillus mulundensis TaxID=1810919 RepID=A0A3D8SIE2_9EURO|nr:hypothetical protein DSM5745_02741 [Aspergillus mulundensis]RDW86099.1 hypothetical protein DSM5745_02741 [Aspergillus mulundensis]